MSPCARHLPCLEEDLLIGPLSFQLDWCSSSLQGLPLGSGVELLLLGEGALDIWVTFSFWQLPCVWRGSGERGAGG